MPSRNIRKTDVDEMYYHAYNRGVNKRVIFKDKLDYVYFLSLFKRYLSEKEVFDKRGEKYPNYNKSIELLCFCLMPNHIHLLVYQHKAGTMQQMMRSIMTSYSTYFNRKYARRGPLFESRYKATNIDDDSYLQHITRYIHLNPVEWKSYLYSSLGFYLHDTRVEWCKPEKILEIFSSKKEYLNFVSDYEDQKQILSELKHMLADS